MYVRSGIASVEIPGKAEVEIARAIVSLGEATSRSGVEVLGPATEI